MASNIISPSRQDIIVEVGGRPTLRMTKFMEEITRNVKGYATNNDITNAISPLQTDISTLQTDVTDLDTDLTAHIATEAGEAVKGHIDLPTVRSEVLGQVLESLYTTYSSSASNIPSDDTIPQNTEGFEVTTLAITPKWTGSKIIVDFWIHGTPSASVVITAALFKDSGADAVKVAAESKAAAFLCDLSNSYIETSGTAGVPITFKLRAGATSGTLYFNGSTVARRFGGVLDCGIRITEVRV